MEPNEKSGKYERYEARQQEKSQSQKQLARKRLMKRLMLWAGVALLITVAVFGLVKLASKVSIPDSSATELSVPVTILDWQKGNPDAKVTLVEYADFQCPACGAYFPMMKQLETEMGDQVKFVFRHYPLKQLHIHAELAARAAEAAGKQGKFWEMHDQLFKNQRVWSAGDARAEFEKYAVEIGIALPQFKKDLDDPVLRDKINAQYAGGNLSGVSGTPSFFLNGKRIANPQSYDELKNIISAAVTANP